MKTDAPKELNSAILASIAKAVQDGDAVERDRTNEHPCPGCGRGKRDWVYQWVGSPFRDDRWFCPCGVTEFPDGSLEDWLETRPLRGRLA